MKKLNIILNSLLIILSNSYPLNETKFTLKNNSCQNENYINIIEIKENECIISSLIPFNLYFSFDSNIIFLLK